MRRRGGNGSTAVAIYDSGQEQPLPADKFHTDSTAFTTTLMPKHSVCIRQLVSGQHATGIPSLSSLLNNTLLLQPLNIQPNSPNLFPAPLTRDMHTHSMLLRLLLQCNKQVFILAILRCYAASNAAMQPIPHANSIIIYQPCYDATLLAMLLCSPYHIQIQYSCTSLATILRCQ